MFLFRRKPSRGAQSAGMESPTGVCAVPSTVLPSCILPGARPELAQQLRRSYSDVGTWPDHNAQQLPIVYHPNYNITLFGIEKLHPFDSCKFEKVVSGLKQHGFISNARQLVQPAAVSYETLQQVHAQDYLHKLQTSSLKVAQVTELAPLAMFPISLVDSKVLQPMRLMVGGTVLAAALAVTKGWAINLGGGMHHAHYGDGSGWCPYADITLAIQRIRSASQGAVQRVMVIDLDVHQGNGVERDKQHWNDSDLCIVDMYNRQAFPFDTEAKAAISVKVELPAGTADETYLNKLQQALDAAAVMMPQPQLIIYNAGTDILAGDPLGRFQVSPEGVAQRDAAVWQFAQRLRAPILMLLSGGYTRASAGVIVDSIAAILQDVAETCSTGTPASAVAPAGST